MTGSLYFLKDLIHYPIKGAAGISTVKAYARYEGLENDRRWMLVDSNGRFISQRECPQLARVKQTLENGSLTVSYREESISFPYASHIDEAIHVTIWDDSVKALSAEKKLHDFFSQILKRNVRLVYMQESGDRFKKVKNTLTFVPVTFADGYPYLFLGTASLDLLNQKLEMPVPFNRFRANIIVETYEPHEEDRWDTIRIGAVVFKLVKTCPRCVVTTINQNTAMRSAEPLKTLAKYRKFGNEIHFAMNAIALNEGSIHMDDEVEVLSWKN